MVPVHLILLCIHLPKSRLLRPPEPPEPPTFTLHRFGASPLGPAVRQAKVKLKEDERCGFAGLYASGLRVVRFLGVVGARALEQGFDGKNDPTQEALEEASPKFGGTIPTVRGPPQAAHQFPIFNAFYRSLGVQALLARY